MAWTVVLGSSQDGSAGNEIWQYENSATAAHTYADAPGTYSSGVRSFDPPGATPAQATYVRCRMVADSVERGELSKTFWDAQ